MCTFVPEEINLTMSHNHMDHTGNDHGDHTTMGHGHMGHSADSQMNHSGHSGHDSHSMMVSLTHCLLLNK